MKSNKKLIVVLSSLCAAFFVGIIAIGIVWAASTQQVSSSIRVVYTADQVAGTVRANTYTSTIPEPMTTDGNAAADNESNVIVSFDAASDIATATLAPQGDISLTSTGKRVVFEYIFTNTSNTTPYYLQLTYADDKTSSNAEDTNINVYSIYSGTQIATPFSISTTGLTPLSSSTYVPNTTVVSAGNTGFYVYVIVEIANVANNAEFSGTFNWAMANTFA